MTVKSIYESKSAEEDILRLISDLHEEGPRGLYILERLTYYKIFHYEIFLKYEQRIISLLGLFYKSGEASDLHSFILRGVGERYKEEYNDYLTPVQASVRRAIEEKQFVSISAPTSAGKSYSIRQFILENDGDAVIIIPSRALIAEYVKTMRDLFKGDKQIMVSAFVDVVYTKRELRRVFVLTPERSRDLFRVSDKLNVKIFFLDEAHISEDKSRGVIFDVLVRRLKKEFPISKIVFAHPFVENPGAQLSKHGFEDERSFSQAYDYGAVGKVCVFNHTNGKSYFFSPFNDKGYHIKKCVEFEGNFLDFAFDGTHSVLVFVSKRSIYRGVFLDEFSEYIKGYPFVDSPRALEIIETVSHLLGADQGEHKSQMVDLLKRGVVIHHGSVPLEVRFLVEDFIKEGYARICFATNTLAQGVNMPFDIVWLDSSRFIGQSDADRSLAFKNLIGRSGRLTSDEKFDFGYVFTKNPKLFTKRICDPYALSESSVLDDPIPAELSDVSELIDSIRNDTFDGEMNLPASKVDRLREQSVIDSAKRILDIVLVNGDDISSAISGPDRRHLRDEVAERLYQIYCASLNRELYDGERQVFDTAIRIFLSVIQGKSFREIVGQRYSYFTNRDQGRAGYAPFSQPASQLPDSTLTNRFSLFEVDMPAKLVNYDAVVFDTYDYLDQVISFSLADVFMAAFRVFFEASGDRRALEMINLLKYGTNNTVSVLLMRYGFPPEDVKEIARYVVKIDEIEVVFGKNLADAPEYIQDMVEWYLP